MRRKYAASPVSYRRAPSSSISIVASYGEKVAQTTDGDGLIVEHRLRDYLVTASDLRIDDQLTQPARGDQIVETDSSGVEWAYEVMNDSGAPPWVWSDSFHQVYRIHTKFVGTTPTSPR